MSFAPSFFLLQQEGYIIHECLTTGLTRIRNAAIGEDGQFYGGFFNLSIGLERMMKAIFIIQYMSENNLSTPPHKTVKDLGHRLVDQFERLRTIPGADLNVHSDDVEYGVLRFLSDFGERSRYHNLDALTSGALAVSPIQSWIDIVNRIAEKDVPRKRREEMRRASDRFVSTVEDICLARPIFSGRVISHREAGYMNGILDLVSGAVVVRLLGILVPLRDLLHVATDRAHTVNSRLDQELGVPYMTEFVDFLCVPSDLAKKKKRWP